MLTNLFADPGLALAGGEFDAHEGERPGLDRAPPDLDAVVAADGRLVEGDHVVPAPRSLARARALRGARIRGPRSGHLRAIGGVVVAEQQRVEVDVALGQDGLCVPVGVSERLEEPVRDERRVVGVAGGELVRQLVAPRDGNVVEPVEGGVADDGRRGAEPRGEPQPLEEVDPLAVPRRLVVAHDGQKGDVGVGEPAENGDGSHEIRQLGPAVVKEVTRVNDRVDVAVDRVVDDGSERVEEVLASDRRVVLLVPDVGVAGVNHPCHRSGGWPVAGLGVPGRRPRGRRSVVVSPGGSAEPAVRVEGLASAGGEVVVAVAVRLVDRRREPVESDGLDEPGRPAEVLAGGVRLGYHRRVRPGRGVGSGRQCGERSLDVVGRNHASSGAASVMNPRFGLPA